MKKIMLTIFAFTILTFSYAQTDTTRNERILYKAGSITSQKDGKQLFFHEDVSIKIDNKLSIESDSAFYDEDKKLLIAYGTKKFTFDGRVTVRKENNRICKYFLGQDILSIE